MGLGEDKFCTGLEALILQSGQMAKIKSVVISIKHRVLLDVGIDATSRCSHTVVRENRQARLKLEDP
ncbi:hypothetical protein GBA52_006876 [Prunus armeniaca]|nr:hypothetical protein GBA52_006876 [Prunus armeniaca]